MRGLRFSVTALVALLACLPASIVAQQGDFNTSLRELRVGLDEVIAHAEAGRSAEASRRALRVYLDVYERIEAQWGGPSVPAPFAARIKGGEASFHALITTTNGAEIVRLARVLQAQADTLAAFAPAEPAAGPAVLTAGLEVSRREAKTREIRGILEELADARAAYATGASARALARVEHAYLEGFEPLEARLPAALVHDIESSIHLRLRPAITRRAPADSVNRAFDVLQNGLLAADTHLDGGASRGFVALNSFVIIVREGLEAVLLIAAILAYLARTGAERKHQVRIHAGAAAGIVASLVTWWLASTLIPVSGASRELIEGITALIAVGVLLFVSHWLFRKTYIQDWTNYLRNRVGRAVSTGSGVAMAALAFAAVYREGFETVLFYQALLFDAGPGPVLAGFVPGAILIAVFGVAIVRLGVKLPLRKLFGVTNAVLLYLAFVFLGKGLYNLHEAGAFAARPVAWLPDHEILRQLAGLYPLSQTLAAQAGLLAILCATWLIYRVRTPATAAAHA